jgi:hypothetical protein
MRTLGAFTAAKPSPAMRRPHLQRPQCGHSCGPFSSERNICCQGGGGERLIERGEGTFFRAASAK